MRCWRRTGRFGSCCCDRGFSFSFTQIALGGRPRPAAGVPTGGLRALRRLLSASDAGHPRAPRSRSVDTRHRSTCRRHGDRIPHRIGLFKKVVVGDTMANSQIRRSSRQRKASSHSMSVERRAVLHGPDLLRFSATRTWRSVCATLRVKRPTNFFHYQAKTHRVLATMAHRRCPASSARDLRSAWRSRKGKAPEPD